MKIYLVGGAVRDQILNLPVKEKDWVVVGATEQDMLSQGYQRVGKEFPVFLHPQTKEEYALARMERSTGPGYKGFAFDTSASVTLEEDLKRRDLTINAIAQTEDGRLIDPYNGKDDIDKRILRHVSSAFKEDPVRILRVARFMARYSNLGFTIALETMKLMQTMVINGEVKALVAERVWKELERALTEPNPEMFFTVLSRCGALIELFPGLHTNGDGMQALKAACELNADTEVRLAALLHDDKEDLRHLTQICKRYRIPNSHKELAKLVATHYASALECSTLSPSRLLELFSRLDIYRREERFNDFLLACKAIARSVANEDYDADWLRACAMAAKAVPVKDLVSQGLSGPELAKAIKDKRLDAIKNWLKENK